MVTDLISLNLYPEVDLRVLNKTRSIFIERIETPFTSRCQSTSFKLKNTNASQKLSPCSLPLKKIKSLRAKSTYSEKISKIKNEPYNIET